MGANFVDDAWAFECRPIPSPGPSPARRRIERAAWFGALAGLICIVPGFVAYTARHARLLPGLMWARLFVETTTFSVFAGVVHSSAIAAGLSLSARGGRRFAGAILLGAISGAIVAAIGVTHFGSKPVPYFGGGTLYATVSIGVLVFAVCHAHSEVRAVSWRRALRYTLTPLPLLAAVVAAAAMLLPHVVTLDYVAFKPLVAAAGLPVVGALGGAAGGTLIGAWTATGALLTRRGARRTG